MNIQNMSLKQKIGQLLMCGFHGHEVPESLRMLIQEHHIGGIIYFARNVKSVGQVAELGVQLQDMAHQSGAPSIWIAVDQEGGMVARLTEGVTLFPGQMALAAGGDPASAYEAGFITGRELKAMGINLNFAPVLDVNNNPANPVIGVRSFGELPERVGLFGASLVKGLQQAEVAATAKHFPGHGDTDADSHLDLPTIPHSRERIDEVELVPFRAAIQAGVDAIMSSHIYFPEYEPRKLPATLSSAVLNGLLRESLGYEGIIVTDCMEMEAIATHYGTVEAAVMALEAGADLILVSHTFELQLAALQAIADAVQSGRLSEERIERSVERLLALKAKRLLSAAGESEAETGGIRVTKEEPDRAGTMKEGQVEAGIVNKAPGEAGKVRELPRERGEVAEEPSETVPNEATVVPPNGANPAGSGLGQSEPAADAGNPIPNLPVQPVALPLDQVGCQEHLETARKWSEASITLVKDEKRLLPLTAKKTTLVISLSPQISSIADEVYKSSPVTLGKALQEQGLDVTEHLVAVSDLVDARIEELVEAAAESEQTVVGTYNACFDPQQVRLVDLLHKRESTW